MQVSRRTFLQLAPLSATAALVSPSQKPTDAEHKISGWRVRWLGWRHPANQVAQVGAWLAWPPNPETSEAWVSTTTGQLQRFGSLRVIDFSRADDSWPIDPMLADDVAFDQAKCRAYDRLVEALRA